MTTAVVEPRRTFAPPSPPESIAGIVAFLPPAETRDYLASVRAFRTWVARQLQR